MVPKRMENDMDEPAPLAWRRWEALSPSEAHSTLRSASVRPHPLDTALFGTMSALMERVRTDGDDAVRSITREFDHVDLTGPLLRDVEQLKHAHGHVLTDELRAALDLGVERIRAYNALQVERAGDFLADVGADRMGQLLRPVSSAALFVPAGKGSFPSVLMHIGGPAVEAGVENLVIVSPPDKRWGAEHGDVDPATVHIASRLGIAHILVANGPAGIAAATFGTESVAAMDMIVGPGSPAIETCQKIAQAAGVVVPTGLGPSDSLIVAQSGIDPEILAADFLSEAEHGADSSVVLFCDDEALLDATMAAADRRLATLPLPHSDYARSSVANGGAFLVDDVEQAMALSNEYAPEHLLLLTHDDEAALSRVRSAGTVLLGRHTPFVASSFTGGTPATLPTTGAARTKSGVTALSFMKRIAVLELAEATMADMAGPVEFFAAHEGFPAHAASAGVSRKVG
jgi:histidinol dehydrogenase